MTAPRRRSVRLHIEVLEDRWMLSANTIVDHGGFVQHNGDVEAVYYGPGWTSSEKGLEASIQNGLHGVIDPSSNGPNSYLATLHNANFGDFDLAFTDSTNTSALAGASLPATVTDQDVRAYLNTVLNQPYNAAASTDRLDKNTSSRVYLIIVDANDNVQDYNGNIVAGYHRTVNLNIGGHQQDVNYVVVAVPGGAANNAPISTHLVNPQLDSVTANASSELIDALTNPSGHGWFANNASQTEIGNDNFYAYVNNDLVVRPFDKQEMPMLPVQAAAPDSVTFLLDTNNVLSERTVVGPKTTTVAISGDVSKVSDQGIDQFGRAMVDYVTATGSAYEFHDGVTQPVLLFTPAPGSSSPLGSAQGPAVLDAKAGQGVSYVLLSNHTVWSYNDVSRAISLRDTNVTALDAGTTFQGVNMVDVIAATSETWEIPDVGHKHSLHLSNVVQISAGRQGRSAELQANGTAWLYEEHKGLQKVAVGAAALASGCDAAGNYVMDLVFAQTNLLTELDYRTAADGKLKSDPVLRTANHVLTGTANHISNLAPGSTISKMRAGVIDMIFPDGAFEGTIDGPQTLLGTNIQRAV